MALWNHKMLPFVNIFGIRLASYGLLIVLALLASLTLSLDLAKRQNYPKEDIVYSFLLAACGAAIAGKTFYILTILPDLIAALKQGVSLRLISQALLQGGLVFLGAFIGAFLSVYLYGKYFKINLEELLTFLLPGLPLAQAIGRIGCLAAGCCYGRPSDTYGLYFNASPLAPHGIKLLPTQLIEAVFCLFILFVLLRAFSAGLSGFKLANIYCFLYLPFRFILEFFRGDEARGSFWIFSTSQWICLILLIALVYSALRSARLKLWRF